MLASGGMDRNIFIWSPLQNYDNVSILKSHTNAITSLAFSLQDNLFCASADKSVSAWNV
jgi:WD40 repeat protein